jgi:uncharacterized protein (DUF1697 family)
VERYAAFLKGVNLGTNRRVSNEELQRAFFEMGFTDITPFRSSGNVVFAAPPLPAVEVAGRIEEGLEAELGYSVRVFLRTGDEVRRIAAHRPFRQAGESTGKLQVGLLDATPSEAAAAEAISLTDKDDLLAIDGRELYWLPPGPMSDSALDLGELGRLLGEMTLRTKATIEELAARHLPVEDR